ncbi:phosphoethanolamine transferase domain-containing protein [Delftia acidovorans]
MLNKNRSLLRKISSNLTVSPAVLIIATGVWLATVGNIPLWKTLLQLQEEIGVTFFIGFLVAVAALNISLLSIFALGPLLKPVLVGAILVNSITSYFMLSYGIVIDPGMIRNTLQTDIGEAIDLLSYELLVTVLGFSIIPIFLIILAGVKKTTAIKAIFTSVLLAFLGLALALVCIFLIYQPFSSTMRNHTKMRYQISPLNTFYSTIKVATNPLDRRSLKIEKIGQDAKIQTNELVNGEEPNIATHSWRNSKSRKLRNQWL